MPITYVIASSILVLLLTLLNPIISALIAGVLLVVYAYTIVISKQKYFDTLIQKYLYIIIAAFVLGYLISLFVVKSQ
jgi:hypothetical protein